MLSSLGQTDFIDIVTEKAHDIIKKDRMRFSEVYRITEDYCKSNDIIISNVNVIIGDKNEKESQYNLYCEDTYKHALNISNLIHSKVGEWVKMSTIVSNQEFIIEYDIGL